MLNREFFQEMNRMRREMDQVFHGLTGRRGFGTVVRPRIGQQCYPPVNLRSDEDNIYAEATLPGIDPAELELTVEQNVLTISGNRQVSEEPSDKIVWHRRERGLGKFHRTIELPVDVKADEVRAEYVNGILSITLPKAEAAKPTRVAIEAA